MSLWGWAGVIAGAWIVALIARWRRDVVKQRRARTRELAHRAAGKLPPYLFSPAPWILAALWLIALWAAIGHPLAAILVVLLPPICWALSNARARRNLRRGRYDAALRQVRLLLLLAPGSAKLDLLRAEILFAAGRLPEAEEVLRTALAQGFQEGGQARAFEWLANTLNALGRHEEALRTIEGAFKVTPRASGLHNALAETHLRQGTEIEEAVAHSNRALDYESKTRRKAGPNRFAEIWANQAWAFGLLGRRDAMLLAVRRALSAADDSECSPMAGVFWRLGMALQSMGESEAARQHFEDARATDPDGFYGRLAAEALQEMDGQAAG